MSAENAKAKILLCEDDPTWNGIEKLPELNDYEVTLKGMAGWPGRVREKFDLCLWMLMPHVDGFTLAEEIRDVNPDVPLFFLSAKTMKEDIIQGYKLGADDYITKPFDSEVLLLKIKAILKRNEELNRIANIEYTGQYHFNPKLRFSINGNANPFAKGMNY
jgi:DNA-binding response OmpR family regulator